MDTSGRAVLKASGLVILALAISGVLGLIALGQQAGRAPLETEVGHVIPKEVRQDPLFQITRAMFSENLKTKFSVSLGKSHVTDLELIAVESLNPPWVKGDGTGVRECFSLVFQGPVEPPLKQNTYLIRHKKLGSFQLFLVPGDTRDPRGPHYEAIINRLYP